MRRELPGRGVLDRQPHVFHGTLDAAIEIGRFGVVDARYYDPQLLRDLRTVRAIRMKQSADELRPVAFLTHEGCAAARQFCTKDMVIRGMVKNEFLSHDIAVHREYCEGRRAIEREGGRVLEIRTEMEFKRDLGRATGRSSDARAAVYDFAQANDLSVIDGGVRIPDCRVVYEMGDGITRHVDLEIASAHHGSKSVQAKQAAGMRVVDRCYPKRGPERHDDMARILR